jgi:hypothetical protein
MQLPRQCYLSEWLQHVPVHQRRCSLIADQADPYHSANVRACILLQVMDNAVIYACGGVSTG